MKHPLEVLRMKQRLSQEQLADITDVRFNNIRDYESGADIPDWFAWRIQNIFEVNWRRFLKDADAFHRWQKKIERIAQDD